MTYDEVKNLPDSQKIVIVEIDFLVLLPYFRNYEAGIYVLDMRRDPDRPVSSFSLFGSYAAFNIDNVRYNLQTLKINDRYQIKADSLASMRLVQKSFYFDIVNQRMYVHADINEHPIDLGRVDGGNTLPFITQIDKNTDAYYNNIYHEPRITSVPSVTKQKDPLFWGLIRFDSVSITMDNSDGYFDDFKNDDIYAQPLRIRDGFAGIAYSEFRLAFSGFVEDINWSFTSFGVSAKDIRKFFSRSLPIRNMTQEEFPGLPDKYNGKEKPLCYGPVSNAPAYVTDQIEPIVKGSTDTSGANKLNDSGAQFLTDGVVVGDYAINITSMLISVVNNVTETALTLDENIFSEGDNYAVYQVRTFTYYFVDTTDHEADSVQEVRSSDSEITPVSVDLTAGTFTANIEDVLETATKLKIVTLDFTGSTGITNSLDQLSDVFDIYGNIDFIPELYNVTEWNEAKALSFDMGLYIGKATQINEVISITSKTNFSVLIIQDDGKITARIYDENRIPVKTIEDDEWLENNLSGAVKSKEFITSAQVNYSKDESERDVFLSITNTDFEQEAFDKFKAYNLQVFETRLTNATDADLLAVRVLSRLSGVFPDITRRTKIQNVDLEIMDFVIANHERNSKPAVLGVYEITGYTKDLHPGSEVTLNQKFVKEA